MKVEAVTEVEKSNYATQKLSQGGGKGDKESGSN